MVQDSSPDFEETWAFLDNRIKDVVNMANTAKQVNAVLLSIANEEQTKKQFLCFFAPGIYALVNIITNILDNVCCRCKPQEKPWFKDLWEPQLR